MVGHQLNRIDRSREFLSVLSNVTMSMSLSGTFCKTRLIAYEYEGIHSQFKTLCNSIMKDIKEANNLLLNASENFQNLLSKITLLATSISKDIQNLKSYQSSFSTIYSIPSTYIEHTLFICKYLELSAKSLADRFEKIVHTESLSKKTLPLEGLSISNSRSYERQNYPLNSQESAIVPSYSNITTINNVNTGIPTTNYPNTYNSATNYSNTHSIPPALRGRYANVQPEHESSSIDIYQPGPCHQGIQERQFSSHIQQVILTVF